MIPSIVFPNLGRLYPNVNIVGIKGAWKVGFGWSANIHTKLPVISQIRKFKEDGFSKVSLVLMNEETKVEFTTDFSIKDLTFYMPAKQKRRFKTVFLL